MAVNRKHHAVDGAPPERWALLGLQLRARRIELGYPVRRAFATAKGLITDKGAPNVRMINAIENNERPGTYAPGRLEQHARAYEVTARSVYDLLAGKTDQLEPVQPVRAPVLPAAPQTGLLREDAVRPYAAPIWDRLLDLATRGIPSPDGAQLGLPPDDAKVWDGSAGAMTLSDRAWLVGDIRRRRDARDTATRPIANSA